jgi:hypothetical protein
MEATSQIREAGDQLLRLGERTVDHRGAAVDGEGNPLALATRLESVTGQHYTRLDELLGEPVHRHELLGVNPAHRTRTAPSPCPEP